MTPFPWLSSIVCSATGTLSGEAGGGKRKDGDLDAEPGGEGSSWYFGKGESVSSLYLGNEGEGAGLRLLLLDLDLSLPGIVIFGNDRGSGRGVVGLSGAESRRE